jgi:hypothetical protein
MQPPRRSAGACNAGITALRQCYRSSANNGPCRFEQLRDMPRTIGTRAPHHRRIVAVALAAASCAVALTACGSANKPPASRSSSYNANLKIADCMRAHRVSNFPDPSASVSGAGGGGFSIQYDVNGSSEIMVNGVSVGGPAYTTAAQTCGLSAGDPVPLSGADREEMVAKAHCIRTHGVPDFPDPKFGGDGGIAFLRPAGYNIQAPAFQQAKKACGSIGIAIPGAGVG